MYLAYYLTHLFIPGHSNNHKAKILHSSTVVIMIVTLLVYQIVIQLLPTTGVKVLGFAANISPTEVISLTNQKRSEAGVHSLNYNPSLESAARAKGEHMLANNYWAHIAPDGTEPWYFFQQVGYEYRYAGENLARDFSNPQSAIDAWMASPSHKENMLSSKYDEVGIAVVEGDLNGVDTTIIVQLFGKGVSSSPTLATAGSSDTPVEVVAQVDQEVEVEVVEEIAPETQVEDSAENIPVYTPPENSVAAAFEQADSGFFSDLQVSPFSLTKSVSLSIIVTLLLVLLLDAYIVSRKKVPRVGGRTFAHVAFLGMVLIVAIIAKAGKII